ncbi:MAG: Smr/MutS family protein [Betaproteobacteria bacterium]|nr:Smr/MutS family protein [Betaproteobacteria bacterium]
MATFKDLSDPRLLAELRRRAVAAEERWQHEQKAEHAVRARAESERAQRSDFAAAIGAVTPLATAPKSASRAPLPTPHPRQRVADEAAALEASRVARDPSPMSWDIGLDIESSQSYVRTGLNPDLLRKLRRGEWVVQGALDLHQHTQEQARAALAEFLADARRQGWRCVRIVHGKGLSSPNREPVLKARVRKWLQLRDEVLAYCEPRPHAGGSGAVVVLLSGTAREPARA